MLLQDLLSDSEDMILLTASELSLLNRLSMLNSLNAKRCRLLSIVFLLDDSSTYAYTIYLTLYKVYYEPHSDTYAYRYGDHYIGDIVYLMLVLKVHLPISTIAISYLT